MQLMIALIVAVGVGAWVYNRMIRTSGNNTKVSLIVSGISAGFAFLVFFYLAVTLLK